jgi:kinesin family protein 2/24
MATMIATVSPGASAADHSLNTLRYADRIKEKRVAGRVVNKKSPPRRKLSPPPSTGDAPKSSMPRSAKRSSPLQSTKEITQNAELADKPPSRAKQVEDELRAVVQGLFEQEEEILNLHMANIQRNAELLSEEGKMLQTVQQENVTPNEIEEYALSLEKILDEKEDLILSMQEKLALFQEQLLKEQELSKKVGSLSQY